MQFEIENEVKNIERKTTIRTKSSTIYPRPAPTYIVAFAVNDDAQVSSNEERLSNGNGTPMTSSKAIELSRQSETKLNFMNEVIMYCGDINTKDSQSINDIQNNTHNETTLQPQVIFSAQKHKRPPKFDSASNKKKLKKNKPVVTVKNIHFKNEHGIMTKNLKKYCKAKQNLKRPDQIQIGLYSDTILKKVSRTRVLKKVLAKENLLEECKKSIEDLLMPSNIFVSSFISGSSQSTLTREDSLSSRNNDTMTVNSVIEIKDSTDNEPYKTDVISVAVAQISNIGTQNRKSYSIIIPQKVDFNASLTSNETTISQVLTQSKSSLDVLTSDISFSNDDVSNRTLMPSNKLQSSENIENASIYFNLYNSSTQSDCTLKLDPTNNLQVSNNEIKDNNKHSPTLYETILNTNVYPQETPFTNAVLELSDLYNVQIAEDVPKISQNIEEIKKREDEMLMRAENEFQGNLFQKPVTRITIPDHKKNVNLPNAAKIKNSIIDSEGTHRKCSEEARGTYPSNIPELLDKLTITLEIAVKRLEESISQKIVDEIRKSLHEFNKCSRPIPTLEEVINDCTSKEIKYKILTKSNETIETIPKSDAYMQCDIMQNEVIDKIMSTFSEEVAKNGIQSSSSIYTHKLKEPKLLKDYFEVLKAPLPFHCKEQEIGKGDSVQISIEDAVEQATPHSEFKKTFCNIALAFIRENVAVIVSVPAFLFVMFVIYCYVMFIVRMWWN